MIPIPVIPPKEILLALLQDAKDAAKERLEHALWRLDRATNYRSMRLYKLRLRLLGAR
jgi:hypothetical protein